MARTEPRRGYFEPDAQPASMSPYTATDDMARRNRIPICGSATWISVVWPKTVISPPMGMMVKMRKAGTTAR